MCNYWMQSDLGVGEFRHFRVKGLYFRLPLLTVVVKMPEQLGMALKF